MYRRDGVDRRPVDVGGKPAVRIPQGASGPCQTATCRTRDDYVAQRRRAIRKQY